MTRLFAVLAAAGMLLASCLPVAASPTAMPTLAPTATPLPTSTLTPTPTTTPVPTSTPTPTPDPLLTSLKGVISSPYWPKLGLPTGIQVKWTSFADGKQQLTGDELASLKEFLGQWEKWKTRLDSYKTEAKITPGLRVRQLNNGKLVLYGIDETSSHKDSGEQLILISHPDPLKTKMLVIAPLIKGLTQRISPDGENVEYIDGKGMPMYEVDGFPVITTRDGWLEKDIKDLYDSSYSTAAEYPRFHISSPGVESGFFGIDKVLTDKQIQVLKDALALFDDPKLKALKPYLFDPKIKYVALDNLPVDYAGSEVSNIVALNHKELFQNKYYLAGVMSHEAAHVLQGGKFPYCQSEIGDGTLPKGFYSWSADELVQGINEGKIGTTHFELWVYTQLGVSQSYPSLVRELQDRIKNKGKNTWDYCK